LSVSTRGKLPVWGKLPVSRRPASTGAPNTQLVGSAGGENNQMRPRVIAREPWQEMSGVDISAQVIWLLTRAKTGPQPTAIARNGATTDGGCEMVKAKNHICFRVDDIEEATSIMADEGFEPVSSCKFKGGGGMSYLDTDKVGGVLTELVEWPEKS
jgi:hypothetical protein